MIDACKIVCVCIAWVFAACISVMRVISTVLTVFAMYGIWVLATCGMYGVCMVLRERSSMVVPTVCIVVGVVCWLRLRNI